MTALGKALVRYGIYALVFDIALLFASEIYFKVEIYGVIKNIALAGAGLIAIGAGLIVIGKFFGKMQALTANRCKKCGTVIPPGYTHCIRHMQE